MLKKSMLLFAVLLMSIAPSFAEQGKVEFDVSDFEVYSIVNDTIKGGFKISNKTEYATDDLYYAVALMPKDIGTFESNIYAYQSKPQQFSLLPTEEKTITFEIGSFINYHQDEYSVLLKIMSKTSTLWNNQAKGPYPLGENTEFLIPANSENGHYYKEKGYEYSLSGPYFDSGKSPTAYIELKSTFDKPVTVKPKFTIYKRSECYVDAPLKVEYGDEITFKSKESKIVKLDLPVMEEPESYLVKVTFYNGDKKISNDYLFRYVVNGVNAKILDFNVLYDDVDEEVKVSANLIGAADGSVLEDVRILITLASKETGEIFGAYNEELELSNSATLIKFNKKLPLNVKSVVARASLQYQGKIITAMDYVLDNIEVKEYGITDVKNTKYEKAVNALVASNILSGYPDKTFKPLNNITRAELTAIALKMKGINIDTLETTINNNFTDVPQSHWAYKTINYAYQEGIISGYGNGIFNPNSNVTYQEAITILLNVIGMKENVNLSSETWPNNYISFAKGLNLLDEISITDYAVPANRGDIALLTFATYLIY